MAGKGPWLNDTLQFKPITDFSPRTKLIISYIFVLFIIIEASFLMVQASKIFINKSAKDVSTEAYLILLITNCFWMFYALTIIGSLAILTSGILYVLGSLLVLIGRWIYGDGSED